MMCHGKQVGLSGYYNVGVTGANVQHRLTDDRRLFFTFLPPPPPSLQQQQQQPVMILPTGGS
jgi:hypothetical protein